MPDIVSNPSRATEIFAKKQGTIHARWQLVDFPPAIPGLPPTHSLQHSRLALLAGRLLRLFFSLSGPGQEPRLSTAHPLKSRQ
ncbi:hypothetical protein CLIM01_06636 [Colletotrichum limetticola]|uniref:Uncharacterized protein n=1 Tax=Colletotrichum limetticola TaxID=1209924 RepID=A0ABQ9PWT3_9PEZI|nr:hypothetical protein CLIM01_06636 [Colletotrichum limetticola]